MTELETNLPQLTYYYLAGPVPVGDLAQEHIQGNCRRAIQLWFYRMQGLEFSPDEMLNPYCYEAFGELISVNALEVGDIVFAERIRDKADQEVEKSPRAFSSQEEYVISLHSAVVHSVEPLIFWHSTAVAGESCFWHEEQFLKYYKPVRARRARSL